MQDYIDENQSLISFMQRTQDQFDKKVIFVGSNRQSLLLDSENGMDDTGSCFAAVDYISKKLGAVFDRFTLSDIYLDLEPGQSIYLFLQEVYKKGWQEQVLDFDKFCDLKDNWRLSSLFDLSSGKFFSEDKINIIYAQIQKVASDHPNDEIVFDFIDDRIDILQYLGTFFRKHPTLIPSHVTLRLFQYQMNILSPIGGNALSADNTQSINYEIRGTGAIDTDYRQTVINMGKLAEKLQSPRRGGYIMSDYITPQLLDSMRQGKAGVLDKQKSSASTEHGFFQPAPKIDAIVADLSMVMLNSVAPAK